VETGVTWGAPLYTATNAQWAGIWDQGIRWSDRSTVIRIDMPMTFSLSGVMLQGHEDDAFQIDYLYQGSWTPLWEAQNTSGGFRTLPTAAQTVRWAILAVPAVEAVRIYASSRETQVAGEMYSLARFQIWGSAVSTETPEPASGWMGLMGLAVLAVVARLRSSKT